jgi:hypothetical protein
MVVELDGAFRKLAGSGGRLFADPQPAPGEISFQVDNTSDAYYQSPYYLLHKNDLQPVPAPVRARAPGRRSCEGMQRGSAPAACPAGLRTPSRRGFPGSRRSAGRRHETVHRTGRSSSGLRRSCRRRRRDGRRRRGPSHRRAGRLAPLHRTRWPRWRSPPPQSGSWSPSLRRYRRPRGRRPSSPP